MHAELRVSPLFVLFVFFFYCPLLEGLCFFFYEYVDGLRVLYIHAHGPGKGMLANGMV